MPVFTQKASWLDYAWKSPKSMKSQIEPQLRGIEFDTIIGIGLSGAMVVPVLARELGVFWAIARKSGDGSHSYGKVEGSIGKKWLFIDDLIETGSTLTRVISLVNEVSNRSDWETEFVGTYLYYHDRYFPSHHLVNRKCECCEYCESSENYDE